MGTLEAIYVTPTSGGAPNRVDQVQVETAKGLVGDRYHAGTGTFSRWGGVGGEGRAVSLVEVEALEEVLARHGIDLLQGQHRRNLVTRGVSLSSFVGKTFRIGPVVLRGTRVCTECRYLDRLAGAGAAAAMHGRPGLRADVLTGGELAVGDPVELLA